MVRVSLRWRLLLLAGLAPTVLALGSYVYLSGVVETQVRGEIDDSLARAARVIEQQFAERVRALSMAARVIARDPSFYAAAGLPGGAADRSVRTTVHGVALGFQNLTHADVFEVWDRRGRILACVGTAASSPDQRARLMTALARGREVTGLLAAPGRHWQVALVPVRADGMLAGALLLGTAIDARLACDLQRATRADVTFVDDDAATGSSLPAPEGVSLVLAALGHHPADVRAAPWQLRGRSDTWVVMARPLPGSRPAQRQSFVIQRSLGQELATLRRAQRALLAVALLAVLLTALLGAFTAERITRPILTLVRGAAAMERGDYDTPIETRGNDEVGYLAMRFRDMRSREREYVTTLEEVARLKSDFITLASHQLRTPIAVIKGYYDLFHEGALGEVTPPQRKALDAIHDSLEGLVQITEDATRIAQIEGERLMLDRADQPLGNVVGEAIALAREGAHDRQVTVESHVPEDSPLVHMDRSRIVQALAHLVRNGIRFTPDGGRVDVRTRADHGGCELEVADTGIGMSAEQCARLMSRAFIVRDVMHHHSSNRLDFGSAGLGLGLAIARGIVEAHGGSMTLESAEGVGSVARIRIPRLALVASQPGTSAAVRGAEPGRRAGAA
jgi:signal transduction histidine kinase